MPSSWSGVRDPLRAAERRADRLARGPPACSARLAAHREPAPVAPGVRPSYSACVPRPGPPDLDALARGLGELVSELLTRHHAESPDGGEPLGPVITAHLGEGAARLPVVREAFSPWDQANVQIALDAALSRPGWSSRALGVAGQARQFDGIGLNDMMSTRHFHVGALEYAVAPVGPGRTISVMDFGVLLVDSPEGPIAVFVHAARNPFGGENGIAVEVASRERADAERLVADLHALMREHDVFRGQVVTVESGHEGPAIVFVERSRLDPADLVLPDGVLDRIERHLVGPTEHRERLLAMGRHLSRGLLLWGPPGTGKTHTVRYLTGRLEGATVIILSGGALTAVGAFATMARRLAPSVVILEDVDLVAEERDYDGGSDVVLFELMNQMSGFGEDADVAFVLTTNRPEALEPALAARPGRIDLAVEIPLPDAAARGRLLELYGRGLDLRLTDPGTVVTRTEGVTASFVKELLRRAALGALHDGREHVTDADVATALDELLSETSALTRVLLGAGGEDGASPAAGWLARFPQPGPGRWDEFSAGSSV